VTRFRLLPALACVLALGLPAIAAAEDTDCRLVDPDDETSTELCRSAVWFQPAETPVGNLGAFGVTSLPTWSDEEPAASVTAGAGGGYFGSPVADIAFDASPEAGVTFEGTHTGPIDNAVVTLHAFVPADNATSSTRHGFRTTLTVDGEPIIFAGEAVDGTLTPAGDAVFELRFALTDLLRDITDFVGTGPDAEHTIELNVTPFYFGDEAVYVYGTTEVPGGIVFNATDEELDGLLVIRP
jgi:hypothetical protein